MRKSLLNDIASFFNYSRKGSELVSDFTASLLEERSNDVYVFGGMIRDVSLLSVENFSSDIDLVFSGSKQELHKRLAEFDNTEPHVNKFGGLRLKLASWDIDIWSIEDTWAFENTDVEYKSIDDLLKTTFMSWDSALFNIRTNKFIVKDNYFSDLHEKHLDLILEDNPNEIGSLVRLAKTILDKDVKSVSSKVIKSLDMYASKFQTAEILEYEKESFERHSLSQKRLLELYATIETSSHTKKLYDNKYYISRL